MSIISYAQNFEDVMLWRALGHINSGVYIDIGAQDPVIDSISLAFHERGWRGVHVEPTPHYAELLRQQRPGDIVIQAAVGSGPSILDFFEIRGTGISTADHNIAARHRERGFDLHAIAVSSVTLSAVFQVCAEPQIHWLKIDVEGFEEKVLSSWGSSPARPWIVVIESTLPLTQIETHQSWEVILAAYDYRFVYFDGLNRYYISNAHPELAEAFQSPPNVFDGFALNGTASAPFHKLIEARHQEEIAEAAARAELQRQSKEAEIENISRSLALLRKTHAESEQIWLRREQELFGEINQVTQKFHGLLRTVTEREQGIADQMLAIQQQAAREILEQARAHNDQERALHLQHVAREQKLIQQLQAGQTEIRTLQLDYAKREQALSERTNQVRQQLNDLLRRFAGREQEASAQLLAIQGQAARERAELRDRYDERERALRTLLVERESALAQQIQAAQDERLRQKREWMQLESALDNDIAALQDKVQALYYEQESIAQQHDVELDARVNAYNRLLEESQSVEIRLKAELLSEQQAGRLLGQMLAHAKVTIQEMRSSRTWRMTELLRKFATFTGPRKAILEATLGDARANEVTASVAGETLFDTYQESAKPIGDVITLSVSESRQIDISNECIEPNMVSSSQVTAPARASTLDELLELYEQEFICSAYQTILSRAPDPEGLRYYLAMLRKGGSKIRLLTQLRLSPEGKAHSASVRGLDAAIRRHQRERLPLVGWVFRLRSGAEGDRPIDRKLRILEHQLFVLSEQSNRQLDQMRTALADLRQEVAPQARSMRAVSNVPEPVPSVAAEATRNQLSEQDRLNQLSPRARIIYHQLKSAATLNAKQAT